MNKYDPNHRQLQITNKLLCESLQNYLRHLKLMAEQHTSFRHHAKRNLEGATAFIGKLGLIVEKNGEGEIVRLHQPIKIHEQLKRFLPKADMPTISTRRQTQITNRVMCDAFQKYLDELLSSGEDEANVNMKLEGVTQFLAYLGMHAICDESGRKIVKVAKQPKNTALKLR